MGDMKGACSYLLGDRGGVVAWDIQDGVLEIRLEDAMGMITWKRTGVESFHMDVQTSFADVRVAYAVNGACGTASLEDCAFPAHVPPADGPGRALVRFAAGTMRYACVDTDGTVTVHGDADVKTLYTPAHSRAPVALDAWLDPGGHLAVAVMYEDGWVIVDADRVVTQTDGEFVPLAIDAKTGTRAYRVGDKTALISPRSSRILGAADATGGRWLVAGTATLDLRDDAAGFREGVPGVGEDGSEILVCGRDVTYTRHSFLSRFRGPFVRIAVAAAVIAGVCAVRWVL